MPGAHQCPDRAGGRDLGRAQTRARVLIFRNGNSPAPAGAGTAAAGTGGPGAVSARAARGPHRSRPGRYGRAGRCHPGWRARRCRWTSHGRPTAARTGPTRVNRSSGRVPAITSRSFPWSTWSARHAVGPCGRRPSRARAAKVSWYRLSRTIFPSGRPLHANLGADGRSGCRGVVDHPADAVAVEDDASRTPPGTRYRPGRELTGLPPDRLWFSGLRRRVCPVVVCS